MRRPAVAIIASLFLVACAQGATRATELVAKIEVGGRGACSVAFEGGAAWATVFSTNEVVRIDPATNRVTNRIRTDGGPCGISAGAGSLWVMTNTGNTVQRIDPATSSVTATIPGRNRTVRRPLCLQLGVGHELQRLDDPPHRSGH
jgi:streptogramin lyase